MQRHPARSGSKRLNSGSSTTGLNSVQPTATITTTTVPGAHQKRGSRRISHSSATASSPISTRRSNETDNTQSPRPTRATKRVFSPTSMARIRLTIVNGSTTALWRDRDRRARERAVPPAPCSPAAAARAAGEARKRSSAICVAERRQADVHLRAPEVPAALDLRSE